MTNEIIRSNRLELLKNEVFGALDVTDATRNEYRVRITHFIRYAETHGINRNSYLDYKRYLASIDTFSVSTKNKIDCHLHSISAHYISVHQKFINKQQPC